MSIKKPIKRDVAAVWAAAGQRVGRGGGLDLVRAMDERLGPSMATMAKLTSASMATARAESKGKGQGHRYLYSHATRTNRDPHCVSSSGNYWLRLLYSRADGNAAQISMSTRSGCN